MNGYESVLNMASDVFIHKSMYLRLSSYACLIVFLCGHHHLQRGKSWFALRYVASICHFIWKPRSPNRLQKKRKLESFLPLQPQSVHLGCLGLGRKCGHALKSLRNTWVDFSENWVTRAVTIDVSICLVTSFQVPSLGLHGLSHWSLQQLGCGLLELGRQQDAKCTKKEDQNETTTWHWKEARKRELN